MQRRSLWAATGSLLVGLIGARAARADTSAQHKIVFHVGSADPAVMSVALGNIVNAASYYAERGETVAIELVANGPGYTMLRADTSPVKDRLAAVAKQFPFVVFAACQHSRAGMAAAEHKSPQDIPEVPEATDVVAGVVRLAELQGEHYAYIRV